MLSDKLSRYSEVAPASDNTSTLLKDPNVLEFVNKYETLNKYDDKSIWNKVITWVLLKPIGGEHDFYMDRRFDLLKKIIENNKEYAPVISYLLIIFDEYYDYSSRHKKRIMR